MFLLILFRVIRYTPTAAMSTVLFQLHCLVVLLSSLLVTGMADVINPDHHNGPRELFYHHHHATIEEALPVQYHPQRGIAACNDFQEIVKGIYGTFNLTCDCGGVLLTAPDTGNIIPITGTFSIKCRSDCFFASPERDVWWYLYWQADFGTYGLEQIRQNSHYVKGRRYVEGKEFWEKFTYMHENDEMDCRMSVPSPISQSGIGQSCQTCEETPDSTINRTCYHIDCSNVNIGTTTRPNYGIEAINNTCELDQPITDFGNHPLAATLGYLQDNVQQIYPEGGAECIPPLASMYERLGDDTECTCRAALDYNATDKRAYNISCRRHCVYGPDNGEEVEFLLYIEGLYVLNYDFELSGGRYHWSQNRYEYIKGRNDTEIFRNIPERSTPLTADECWATQNSIQCESCVYTSNSENSVNLNCSNLPNGLNFDNWPTPDGFPWSSQPDQMKDVTSWMVTPFAAGLFGKDRVCKRNVTEQDVAIVEARYAPPSSAPTIGPTLSPLPESKTPAGPTTVTDTAEPSQNEVPSIPASDNVTSASSMKSHILHCAAVVLGGVITLMF